MPVLHSFLANVAFAIIALVGVFIFYMKRQHTYWQRRGVATPADTHWFYGNAQDLVQYKKAPSVSLAELYLRSSKKDDLLGIYLFHKPFLLLTSPELIKQILVKDFNYFPNRHVTARSLRDGIGHTNLFTIKAPHWRHVRTKLSPVFTSKKLKNLFDLIVVTAESMSNYLEQQFLDGTTTKTVRIRDVSSKFITDVISSVAFGVKVNSFDPANQTFFKKTQAGFKLSTIRALQVSAMFFFPCTSPYVGTQLLGRSTEYFRKVFWNSVDTREASKTKRGDLIDFLIDLKNEKQESDFKFKGDALLSQSAIFFIAGRESSVTTICFTLYELAKNPEIQKRARDEIREKLKEHGMTYDGVMSMKYLHQVVSETLRLYPAVPLLDRVAVDDYKIPGTDIVIEKGIPILIPLYALHCDPRYHPDPMRYDPDRFSDENKDRIEPYSYVPFGEGPRVCIGMKLAFLQTATALITILTQYEATVNSACKCEIDNRNVFITPKNGFRIMLTKL